jgi:4-hydroxybenzoyl-CoA thioesterase
MLKRFGIAGIPIVDARAKFLVPSQFGDTIVVESQIASWGRSSFAVHHRIFRDKTLAAEVDEIRVWVTRAKGESGRLKGQAIPQEVKRGFARGSRQRG